MTIRPWRHFLSNAVTRRSSGKQLVHQRQFQAASPTTAQQAGVPACAARPLYPASCATGLKDEGITAAASYQWGPVKLAAVYETLKYDIATGGDLKRTDWGVSMTANWGPGQFYAGYWKGENGRGSAQCQDASGHFISCGSAAQVTAPRVGGVTGGPSTSTNMYEFSYTYPLSKRTLLYAGYVMIDNFAEERGVNFHVNQIVGVCTGNNAASNLGVGSGCRLGRPSARSGTWHRRVLVGYPATRLATEVQSDHTGAFGRPFFSPLRRTRRPVWNSIIIWPCSTRSSSASIARFARWRVSPPRSARSQARALPLRSSRPTRCRVTPAWSTGH